MQQILSLFLLVSMVVIAKSQTWEGNYTVQAGCNTTVCCCFNGQVAVTRQSGNQLNIRSGVTGTCNNATTYETSVPDPNGFKGTINIVGGPVNFTLSSDSREISTASSTTPECNGKAIKNGNTTIGTIPDEAIKQHMNIYMLLVALVLLQLITNFAKI